MWNQLFKKKKQTLSFNFVIINNIELFLIKTPIYILLLLCSINGLAQNYADKSYYLVDSLNLDELQTEDKNLLKTNLELFHNTTNDTTKVNALLKICNEIAHKD